MEWDLRITPKVRFRTKLTEKAEAQDYALVISIEDPNRRVNLYEAVKTAFEKQRRMITKPLEAYIQHQPLAVPSPQKSTKVS